MNALPLAARLGFTLWMLIWVPLIWWAYGPQNFLWLCNLALFLVLYAVWAGNRLVLSSQAGMVTLIGIVWTLDLLVGLIMGGSPTGATAYMWDESLPLAARLASLYHVALPIFLLWCLVRLGYDRRGPWLQCLIGSVGILGGWLLTEPERNINWIFEPFGMEQVWFPEPVYVALVLLAYPLMIYLPGHYLVRWIVARFRGRLEAD